MEPIELIVSALSSGAAAALKPTVTQAIKDAYNALKTLIKQKYDVELKQLEKKPESKKKQESLIEDLQDAKAENDTELLQTAKTLLDLMKEHEPETARALGIDWEEVEIGYARVGNINSEGTGSRIRKGKIDNLEIGDIDAGGSKNR